MLALHAFSTNTHKFSLKITIKQILGIGKKALHSQKKGFFNGSSKWPKVLPGTFCYLNQAKRSPNYTQL